MSVTGIGPVGIITQGGSGRAVKTPGPDHPISITPHPGRVVVRAGGRVIADTHHALEMREAAYPAVLYVPRSDTDMTLLERTSHTSYCPYKGDCTYYSIPAGGERSMNAVWSYEAPFTPVAAITAYLAFYPDRVDEIASN